VILVVDLDRRAVLDPNFEARHGVLLSCGSVPDKVAARLDAAHRD